MKVQFHWDRGRQGRCNSPAGSASPPTGAGKQWGAIRFPASGQEVVIDSRKAIRTGPSIVWQRLQRPTRCRPYTAAGQEDRPTLKSRSFQRRVAQQLQPKSPGGLERQGTTVRPCGEEHGPAGQGRVSGSGLATTGTSSSSRIARRRFEQNGHLQVNGNVTRRSMATIR